MAFSAEVIAARRVRGFEAARVLIASGRGEQVQHTIRRIVEEMSAAEQALLTERQAKTHRSSTVAMQLVLAGSVLAFGAVFAAFVIVRRDFAGARQAQRALRGVNATLEVRTAERTAELTRINEHLVNAHQELRVLVEQAPLAIAMFDRDMRYIVTSRRWIGDYGRGRGELVGLSHYEVHPDIPQSWIEVHRRGLAGEFLKHEEDMWVQADGSKHWLRWAVSALAQ
jgi:PAS domain S-box-containing protein